MGWGVVSSEISVAFRGYGVPLRAAARPEFALQSPRVLPGTQFSSKLEQYLGQVFPGCLDTKLTLETLPWESCL